MNNEVQLLLNDLLAAWHCYCKGYRWVIGYKPVAAGFSQVTSSRQWDSLHEVLDRDVDSTRLKAVDFHINELDPEYRTSLQIQARNLATGANVWTSARLPKDPQERISLLCRAREMLISRLNMQ